MWLSIHTDLVQVVKVDYWLVRTHSKNLLLFTVSESNKDELSVVLFRGKPALKSESINRSGFKCEQFNPISVCPRGIWTLLTHLQLHRLPCLLILCVFPPFCFFCSLIHHCWLSWWLFSFMYTREGLDPVSALHAHLRKEKSLAQGVKGRRMNLPGDKQTSPTAPYSSMTLSEFWEAMTHWDFSAHLCVIALFMSKVCRLHLNWIYH